MGLKMSWIFNPDHAQIENVELEYTTKDCVNQCAKCKYVNVTLKVHSLEIQVEGAVNN